MNSATEALWPNLMHMSLSPLNFIIRATVVFIFVLILLRIAGKRQMGQMSPTEFVAILLISNAVQNSMNGGDNSLSAGLLLATALIFLSYLISYLTYRSRVMSSIFEGTPTLLIYQGKVIEKHMNQERVTMNELKTLLRKQDIHALSDVKSAILEADGTVSVEKFSDDQGKGKSSQS